MCLCAGSERVRLGVLAGRHLSGPIHCDPVPTTATHDEAAGPGGDCGRLGPGSRHVHPGGPLFGSRGARSDTLCSFWHTVSI